MREAKRSGACGPTTDERGPVTCTRAGVAGEAGNRARESRKLQSESTQRHRFGSAPNRCGGV